ncbi:MAG: ATP-dependent RecD-like DNA helicase [Myxococcota bacterium]|nr:ATP-dependent RecD-like DNA helicase [Myxococcota bacterium]
MAQATSEVGVDSSLAGQIERVTFHRPEGGFCVLRVRVSDRRELVTVIGNTPSVSAGEGIRAEGRFERDPRHGLQFKARELAVAPPSTREGIEKYLASGAVHGVGPELARRLVGAFGERVFDVVERAPHQLRDVEGVGAKRAQSIARAFRTQSRVRELMLFLHSHGLGTARAARIHRRYGERAVEQIREDPYCLARDIRGIGFATADGLARQLGIAPEARIRLRAGLHHVLDQAASDGHCGLPEQELLRQACELLAGNDAALHEALESEITAEQLVRDSLGDDRAIFVPRLHRAEREAAARLRALAETALPWPDIDPERAMGWAEAELGVELARSQREAVAAVLGAKVAVLTGGPGVGKTTLMRTLLAILRAKQVRVELAAPTGRAARRLADATGLAARTLHRLLEVDPSARGGFRRGVELPLDCDLVVVDEASMVDVMLFAALLRAIPRHAALLLVGDADQLPSVGPGRVLADVIDSGAVTAVRLVEVFRQAEQSGIIRAAHAIHAGRTPELGRDEATDFFFIEAGEPERAAELVLTVVRERIPRRFGLDPLRDVQVLTPMHRGVVGTENLNALLQRELNPGATESASLSHAGYAFAQGDKVMQTENDYDKDVFNGDLGKVERVDPDEGTLQVAFDGRSLEYERSELDSLALAYAITVHKSQGSEYPAVVLALSTQHYPMLERRLAYTAITRGKQLVVVVGQQRALEIALRRDEERQRHSKLAEWLRAPKAL